ncbi:MAG TPA: 23S rRNA (guanosine(2251)-2'-O)-methyltransferase RlmB, partial [Acidimicrobiales bacterium]|nr:23S rRNA (guanosine(2251)-2'-O)-methyltransferase RlmB [Acidimicrobiales bacterium]
MSPPRRPGPAAGGSGGRRRGASQPRGPQPRSSDARADRPSRRGDAGGGAGTARGQGRRNPSAHARQPGRSADGPRRAGGTTRAGPPGDRAHRHQRGLGGEQVEGRRAVEELLSARRRAVRDVWVAEGVDPSPTLDRIIGLASSRMVPVRWVPRARLEREARTESHQGVLAHAEPLPEADLDELATGDGRTAPFLVVLDGVTDPGNLGAVMRTAECAGATGVVIARHGSAHVTGTVAKAAAGAVERLPIAVVPGIPGALTTLARHGVWSVGLDAGAPDTIFGLDLADRPVALVLGAEDTGLARLTRQRCDVLVSIPRLGAIASLNVAAAAAVACFEVARRR